MRTLSLSRPLWLLAIVALFAAGVACGKASTSRTEPPADQAPAATATLPATPAPTATPVPEDLGQGSVELIRRGWQSVVDLHIAKPAPAPLLIAAWREAVAAARGHGVREPPAPVLGDDQDAMWDAFSAAYVDLLDATSPDNWDEIRFAAFNGMTKSLNDCHTFFLPPQRSEVLTNIRTGRGSGGIGIELAPVKPSYVRETISDGPAQRAGILPGDYVLSVDGQDVTSLGIEVISDLLRGEPGSSVSVQVRRPGTGAVLSFPLTRALVKPPVADGRVLDSGFGYIRMRSFTTGGTLLAEVDQVVEGFEAQGVKGWVIDLRDNPGGDSDLQLDGRFIGAEVSERTVLRDDVLEANSGEGDPYPGHPIAVLVNGGTASVGEIFAAMLQDYGRGRIFGTQTAKCAGFVSLQQYPDGSTLGVTIAHALTPRTERPLWQTGVTPDQVVRQTQDDVAANRDPVMDAAIGWLRTQGP